jgi:hypothetical protein
LGMSTQVLQGAHMACMLVSADHSGGRESVRAFAYRRLRNK